STAPPGDPGQTQKRSAEAAGGDAGALKGARLQPLRRMSADAGPVPGADHSVLRLPEHDRVPRRRVPLAAGSVAARPALYPPADPGRVHVCATVGQRSPERNGAEPADEDDDVL